MNNIRSAIYRAVSLNSYVYLDKETKEDLRLWLEFVQAKEGISINRIGSENRRCKISPTLQNRASVATPRTQVSRGATGSVKSST